MIEQLENLVRTGGLKTEPTGATEDEKLLAELLQATDALLERVNQHN